MSTLDVPDEPPRADAEMLKRITARLFATANEQLIPPRRVYAILDGARDRSIIGRVTDCPGVYECLYREVHDPDLASAAPWLAELKAGDEWTNELLRDAWGRSWCIFVEAALPPLVLYRHLRTFLKVVDAAQRTLVFRYYDPRVWRAYAPTCNGAEARQLTGPLVKFCCEASDGRALLQYAKGPEGFVVNELPLEAEPASPVTSASAPSATA